MSSAFSTTTLQAIGTTAVVVVEEPCAVHAKRLLVAELDAIDLACSRFRDDSELTRLNRRAGRVSRVGPLLREAVRRRAARRRATGGDVDPTVAPALVRARLRPRLRRGRSPTRPTTHRGVAARRLAKRRARPRARGCVRLAPGVRAGPRRDGQGAGRRPRRARPSRARDADAGVLVDLGGDLAIAGRAPAGGWPVRVADDHRAGPGAAGPVRRRSLGGGLATSSTTVRRWRARRARRPSHRRPAHRRARRRGRGAP